MLFENFQQALVKIILQRSRVLKLVLAHEGLDMRIGLPLNAVILVVSDVHEAVGEDGRHLCNKSIEEFISAFAGRIHHRVEDAKLPLDEERPGRAGQIGVSDEPRTGMSRHVELRHNTDAALARIGDNFARLLLRVEQAVRAQPREFGESTTLDAETLVFRQMPVKNVQFNSGHAIDGAPDNLDWNEVASAVDHKAAPAKARCIVN